MLWKKALFKCFCLHLSMYMTFSNVCGLITVSPGIITSQDPIIFHQSNSRVKCPLCIETKTQQSFKGTGLQSQVFKVSPFSFPGVWGRNPMALLYQWGVAISTIKMLESSSSCHNTQTVGIDVNDCPSCSVYFSFWVYSIGWQSEHHSSGLFCENGVLFQLGSRWISWNEYMLDRRESEPQNVTYCEMHARMHLLWVGIIRQWE